MKRVILMDLFEQKDIKRMLIAKEKEPFDSEDYIYVLKLDGMRCIAYLDHTGAILMNKRNFDLLPRFPIVYTHQLLITLHFLNGLCMYLLYRHLYLISKIKLHKMLQLHNFFFLQLLQYNHNVIQFS